MQRFVAFLDILGFKNLVKQKGISEMIEIMNTFKSAIDVANNVPIPGATTFALTTNLVRFATFSDSIVLYTEGLESHDFFRIVHVTKALISCSLMCKTPLRGAIAHGEFYADEANDIFFGNALIDAYENETKQQWAGAYICDNTIDYVSETFINMLNSLKKFAYLIEYEIPFKTYTCIRNGAQELKSFKSKYNITINWANTAPELEHLLTKNIKTGYPFLSVILDPIIEEVENDSSISEDDKKNLVFQLDKTKIKEDILEKWDNTRLFFEYAKDKGKTPLHFAPKPHA